MVVDLIRGQRARNSKHPEPKPKSQNPKPSCDPTNPNHPIESLVPVHVPDQLQPKAFLILDELSFSYHPRQLAFPDSKRPVRTRRSSRSRSDIKQLASPISRSRPQPQSVCSQLASRPARARNSKHPEPKPKSQNPKPSRDPTNPNHPIASLVPAHVPDQLQPKAFLILDELSLSYHPGQLTFPDSKRPIHTRRSSRYPTANSSRPRSAVRDLSLNPFAVSSRPGKLASSPARGSFFGGPVSIIN
ncbi:hypothetical protein F2Q69_00054712 [Brassica cretica]|uniref:Uncharacterized protein n=1 Tax=Brassica cretica TaxID=69181 RepID=A0A8S9MX59_BRACR|nr:hypothetical protein F2Q69_00054712 [Brassica cretica]